ncbi:RidA family protein [Tenggerimyces flavus]|uniref:RidA family protein n=1 Tax=Tenggerimyces flavus TaxID=1708749 RepID=A0ABV7YIE2_9ACTN|nr:RidA family protein [Tenggerimyces flavus]MBM7784163.1 enamine deaminase RidA (YjgF/YER057c/UK114 family) [Tenggerimyces flavus]
MVDGYNPAGIWAPNGRSFQQGVIQGDGQVVHVTGQVAWDADSNVVGVGDAETQLEKAFDNVRVILEAVGGRLDDIVSQTIYFVDRDDLPAIQHVRSRHFPAETAPVSILIQAAGLVIPELVVEVVPIAVVPHDRFQQPA